MNQTLLSDIVLPVFLTFSAVGFLVYFVAEAMARQTTGLKDRLERITGSFSREELGGPKDTFLPEVPDEPMTGFNPSFTTSAAARPDYVPTLTKLLSGHEIGKTIRTELLRAGMKIRPAEFIALFLVCGVAGFFIGYCLTSKVLVGIALASVGLVLPVGTLKYMQSQRKVKFETQLPDVLALVSSSLRTGYSFMHSTQLVVDEMPPPMSEEFAWVIGEATLGVPMDTALQRLVERMNSYDLDLVVTAISIQLQIGGNLAEILDTIAGTIRERARIKSEIAALTAEGKLSGVILFLLPIVLAAFINFRTPEYFKPLLTDPMGGVIIGGTLFMMVLGGVIINKLVNIDV